MFLRKGMQIRSEVIQHIHESNAKKYYEAYTRCWVNDGVTLSLGEPAITCAAFSAELGMKAILSRDGEKVRGHNLKTLLDQLSIDDKSNIISLTSVSFPDFDVQLQNASQAFVEWRYIHEQKKEKNLNIVFLGDFAKSILSVLSEKKYQVTQTDAEQLASARSSQF
jgi:HEPN domain-containing protein